MSYSKEANDIGILRADGSTKVGLMLARDKNGVPLYWTDDDEFLATQTFTGVAGYGALPPEKEIAIRQDDWRSGFGLEVYDANDEKRYYSSIGADLRHRGMAIAGMKATAISLPSGISTAASILNTTMEADANWTGGIRDNDQAHGGTYSRNVGQNAQAYQDATTWAGSWQSKTFAFSGWVYAINPSTARLAMHDGIDLSYSPYHTGSSTWEFLSVTKELSGSANKLRVELRHENVAGATYFDDVILSSPIIGAIVASAEFNSLLYLACGTILTKLNATGNGLTVAAVFPVAITDIEAFTDGKLYIAQGASNNYWYMTTAEVLTYTDSKALFFKAVGATMWKALLPRSIYSATNPTANAGWSGVTSVDSSFYSILNLLTDGTTLVVKKEDRTFYISGGVQILIGETKHLAGDTSGKCATEWQKKYYIGCGSQSLVEYDGGAISWRSPAKFCTDLSEFVGKVQAVVGDEEYLYAIVDNSTKIEILAGRTETIDNTTGWVWHPIAELTLTGCQTAFISSVYKKRLWIASTNSSDSFYYYPLTTKYGDITNDSDYRFMTNTYFITPKLHGNFKGDNKSFIKIMASLGHTYDADIYFECHYKKEGDSSWTDAGDLIGTATNRIATLYFPVDASANKPTSINLRLKFVAKTDDDTKTPVLLGYDVRAILYPPKRRVINAIVRCADDITDNQGNKLDINATDIKTILEEAADATWPVTMYDIDGATKTIRFLPTRPFSRVIKREKDRTPERWFSLVMQEVTLS